ncbi:MAG TPA: glycerol kinase GlpK [Gaiellaceae bacterium]|nr:glycerol kinase GlpK [Gaiellaceae bacterium]
MILAVDQGTTATTCLVVDDELRVLGRGTTELPQHFPRPGWVEHDPEEIWGTVLASANTALGDARLDVSGLDAVAIANQRETILLWERGTGRPVAPAIVWQDRRTADRCAQLDRDLIRERTGLVPDPYFSATKLEWLLERTGSHDGLAVGTVDSWLAWRFTRGARHVTDRTNASRTMLCSLETLAWDDELLALFGVERSLLPEIVDSGDVVGEGELFGATIEVRGLAGDQQAALYGHGCHRPGEGKATYGTGSFVLVHTGDDASPPPHGLLRTAAADGYALEGAILVAGAALQWLRDGLGLIASAAESESLAESVEDTGGVVFVPALAGLGSPWWDADARGLIAGLTRGTTRAQLVRAALEAIAHQVADVVDSLPAPLQALRVDGGASANRFLMQLQADLLGVPVEVAADPETTALGAAALAAGTSARVPAGAVYEPRLPRGRVEELREGWSAALDRARTAERNNR